MGMGGSASAAASKIGVKSCASPAIRVNLLAGGPAKRPTDSRKGDCVLLGNDTRWLAWEPRTLSILRFVAGLMFLQTGMAKLFGFPQVAMFAHLQLASLLGVQGVIEVVGGALIAVGLFTRPVAFVLCGDMAFAYFIGHFPKGFFPAVNGGAAAILYCFVFLHLSVAGGGVWSLDRLLFAPRSTRLSAARV
jgi:putative oxidoreductase